MRRRARWLLVAGAGAVIVAVRPFRVEVVGRSMEPTLHAGDWLVVTRAGRVRRGCVVVLAHPDGLLGLVKRVSAVPGDEVDGRRLGSTEFLVAGDNRAESSDSRSFGPVAREDIQGVVRFRYRPRPSLIR